MSEPTLDHGFVRPRRAKSVMPEIVLFSLCALTLFIGLAG